MFGVVLLALTVSVASGSEPTASPTASPSGAIVPLPKIGSTRSRAVCSALRNAVGPLVAAAMRDDATVAEFRQKVRDYVVVARDDEVRRFRLRALDDLVHRMVGDVDVVDAGANSRWLEPTANSSDEDRVVLERLKSSLRRLSALHRSALDALAGLVETERLRLFREPGEAERQTAALTRPPNAPPSAPSDALDGGSLERMRRLNFSGSSTLAVANAVDGDFAAFERANRRREEIASAVIVPAAATCR